MECGASAPLSRFRSTRTQRRKVGAQAPTPKRRQAAALHKTPEPMECGASAPLSRFRSTRTQRRKVGAQAPTPKRRQAAALHKTPEPMECGASAPLSRFRSTRTQRRKVGAQAPTPKRRQAPHSTKCQSLWSAVPRHLKPRNWAVLRLLPCLTLALHLGGGAPACWIQPERGRDWMAMKRRPRAQTSAASRYPVK